MQNKYTKLLIVVLALAIIVPQIAMAAWWNPFSWGIWNRIFHFQRTEQKQEQQNCKQEGEQCGYSFGKKVGDCCDDFECKIEDNNMPDSAAKCVKKSDGAQVGKCEIQSDCPTIYCIKAPCPQNKCINNTCMPVILLDDVYPLFLDGTLSWASATEKITQIPVKNTTVKGYEIKAKGIINQNQDAGKFFNYYDQKLKASGWVDENNFSADGIKGSQRGYKKGDNYIIMSYNITPGKIISGENEPLQWECPCDVIYTIMSGGTIKK